MAQQSVLQPALLKALSALEEGRKTTLELLTALPEDIRQITDQEQIEKMLQALKSRNFVKSRVSANTKGFQWWLTTDGASLRNRGLKQSSKKKKPAKRAD